jgi:hypothetical protein
VGDGAFVVVVGRKVDVDVVLELDVELEVELVLVVELDVDDVVGCSVEEELEVDVLLEVVLVVGDTCAAAGGTRMVSTTGSIIDAAADSESRRIKDRREIVDGSGSSTTTRPASASSASASSTISWSAGRPVRR